MFESALGNIGVLTLRHVSLSILTRLQSVYLPKEDNAGIATAERHQRAGNDSRVMRSASLSMRHVTSFPGSCARRLSCTTRLSSCAM